MINQLWTLLPTQALGIFLAFIAIWWIEPATAPGMAVLAIIIIAFVNVVQQAWKWLSPFFLNRGEAKAPKPRPAKPKHKPAR